MALATCTAAGLIEAGACFTSPQFTSHQRKAIMVYLLNQVGAAVGASVSSEFSDLLRDAICMKGYGVDQKEAAIIGILNGGVPSGNGWANVGDSLETLTVAQLVEGTKCLTNYTEEQLDLMMIRLFCLIFSAQVTL